MEILVTVIAFWLILVGAYGAYSLSQERGRERAPKVHAQRTMTPSAPLAGANGPFRPVTLPEQRVPSFISRVTSAATEPDLYEEFERQLPRRVEVQTEEQFEATPDRFHAEKIIAARLQQARELAEEPMVQQPPRREPARRPTRREVHDPDLPSFEPPARPAASEVDFLRAEVQHLRSEIFALSAEQPRQMRPKQRRYRTGATSHLPRTLRRQVNEVRGFRRLFN